MFGTSPSSLAAVLGHRVAQTPERTAYVFLPEGEDEQERLTYGALNARARAVGAALGGSCRPGDRALLLHPPGLDFLTAFLGCLYAGVIAVPAYPPRSPRSMPRLQAMLADAQPAVVLAPTSSRLRVRGWLEKIPQVAALPWLATDELDSAPTGWEPAPVSGDAVAFLQYTSGSISTPKGVMVSHANLLHNEELIRRAFRQSESSVVVSWLPPYHDMGLIGGLLQPLYVGARCVLMPPMAFLQKPLRWLQAISRHRGTTSGGPNFAYDLCVRRARGVPPAEIERLDLSCWEVAFNGAEPVRRPTLDRFAAAFAGCGFRREAFVPCYGLAEATLLVSAAAPSDGRTGSSTAPVSCGGPAGGEVLVVEPESGAPCPGEAEGEIWVAGPSVAQGYWNRPEETRAAFGARLQEGRGPYLRTGDLGVLRDGELYVTGRIKDLIILRGRNLHPQDVEATAREAHPALAEGMGAAFSLDAVDAVDAGEERLVVVHEVERHAPRLEGISAAIREAIAREHEALAFDVVLVPAGGVPRTTSGKVRRRACRDLYLQGGLRVLGASRLSAATAEIDAEMDPAEAPPGSLGWLLRTFAAAARIDPSQVDPDRPLAASGLDSLAAIELKHAVEEATGASLPLPDLLEGMTLREIERRVAVPSPGRAPALSGEGEAAGEHPLSWNQRSLWFVHRLDPGSPAYNIAGAARLHGTDAAALERSLQTLLDRHPMLRSSFGETPEGPVQRVAERSDAGFAVVDGSGWSDEEVHAKLRAEAFRPFDLSTGPLLRAALVRRGEEDLLVLAVHHIAADFWSIGVLARELGALLAGGTLPPPGALYTDFIRWQTELLAGPDGARLWAHWRERLEGAPPLDLPTDRPRRPVQTLRGGSLASPPSPERTEALRRLAAAHGCTPFVALLAAWQGVLSRWSGQEDFLVGAPMAGRPGRAWSDVVGYFANPVPLRAALSGDPSVCELMAGTRSTVLAALEHQDFPWALMVERLQPERDPSRPPLVAAMLAFEKVPEPEMAALAAFSVAAPDVRLDLGGLALTSLPLASPAAQLDLSLTAAELSGGLVLFVQWDADLFDAATAGRMLGHLDSLLAGMVAAPERRAAEIPLLTAAERAQILLAWSGAGSCEPAVSGCLHELFEAQAARSPEATALIDGEERWTYDALNRWANRLAHRLRRLGAGPEQRVGLLMRRSGEMVAALLAILKAGAAYVPLDPAYPAGWLAQAADDARLALLVTEADLRGRLAGCREVAAAEEDLSREPEENPEPLAEPGNLAYVMYTSGSTGRPKGVAHEHRAPVARMGWARAAFPAEALAGVLASTSICFDLSVFELFAPLSWGGTVILAGNALALPALPAAGEVTLINTVPSAMTELAPADLTGLAPRLRTVCLAGEALPLLLAERLYRHPWIEQVFNLYGPTEDATYSTWARIERGASRVSIGRPLPGTRAYVLDRHLQPAPGGVPGELYLAGAGGARGYLGRPDLTAERFLPDPFSGLPGGRLYRTGDRARWLAAGELEHLGRLDHQVKVRGFRIELGEIETVLSALPGVREAVVVARSEGSAGGRRLVAYVTGDASPEALRQALRERLPDFMVPAAFVTLAALPLTPNGKVDRKALPAPPAAEGVPVAPHTPVEEVLAGIWAEVLELEQVGVQDNLFALGGHSLLAARIASRVQGAFGVELPLRALFERPTVEALARTIEEARRAEASSAAPPPLPVLPVPRGADLPLSFAQERLWFLERLAPGQAVYNIPVLLRLRGPVSPPRLAAALTAVAARHEALRTVFASRDGVPVQVIRPAAPLAFPVVDLSGLPEPSEGSDLATRQALDVAGEAAARPFDLASGPLVRGLLLRLGAEHHLAALTLHHIAFDGWSTGVLLSELGRLYTGEPLPPPAVQYADFAVWQRAWLDSGALAAQLGAWRERLAGAPTVLDLPADRPRPAAQTFRGRALPVSIPAGLVRALRAVGRRGGATLFMTVLAGWAALLHRWSGAPELLVGTPVANRRRPELEGLVGLFVNTLPLRLDLGDDPPFAELLGRVRATALAAYEGQDVPFERIVEAAEAERDLSRSPLFQTMLALGQDEPPALRLPGVAAEEVPIHNGTAKFELLLALNSREEALSGGLEFNADLFDAATGQRLVERLARLLAEAAAVPQTRVGDLPLLDEAEERQILVEWNATAAPFPRDLGLHELFLAQAARTPGATALVHGEERIRYAELEAWAGGLARRLRALGVGPEVLVGIFCGRTPAMVAAALAVLEAGGAYLPLDPAYPPDRLRFLLADSGAPVVLAEASVAGGLPEFAGTLVLADREAAGVEPGDRPRGFVHPEQAAYAIYTSGSTGAPKGVIVRHGSAVNRIAWAGEAYSSEELAGVLAATSLCFDLSVFEIFAPLAAGGAVVLVEDALALPALPALPAALAVTLVNTVPSAMAELARAGALPRSVRVVNLAGEPLRRDLAARLFAQGIDKVYNLYGPSEDTTYSTGARFDPADEREPAIGRPLPNTRAFVLDPGLRPVPMGTPGELWLGGEGLARGYLRRPDLTADRFRPDPFGPPGSRLYRSGDRARWRPEGTLDFLGRLDQQVKVRGYRIEPGEIEAALLALPGVREAVVMRSDDRLVAWVAGDAPAEELRQALRARLPAFLVPAAFVFLEALPRTPNGKIDRKALPIPRPAAGVAAAPRTPTEEVLTGIWAEVLGLEQVGLHDSFFDLGGHSLLATRVASRLRSIFGVELPLRALFERPTVAELATAVEEARRGRPPAAAPPLIRVPRGQDLPLSFAQERLWFLDRLAPGQATYNIPLVLRIAGPLRPASLALCLGEIVRRHESLRTVFAAPGGPPVQVIRPAAAFGLGVVDLSGLPASRREDLAVALTREEADRPFDLTGDLLLRGVLLRLAEGSHLAALTFHHIASDGWSLGILLHELTALYAASVESRPSPLPELPVQYADFALWQRRWLAGETLEQELSWWRGQLRGMPGVLDLPADHPRPAIASLRGAEHRFVVSRELAHRLAGLGRQQGATLYMILAAALSALLARLSGQSDLSLGSPIANRNWVETEGLIGCFVNTLVLRTKIARDASFMDLLLQAREASLGAYAHQDLPFEKLVDELQPERDLSRSPLVQVALAVHNVPLPPTHLEGLRLTPEIPPTRVAKFDLAFIFGAAADGGLAASLQYTSDLWDAPTAVRLSRQFLTFLDALTAEPGRHLSDLSPLTAEERHQVLREWNDTAEAGRPDRLLHQLFAARAEIRPDALAAVSGRSAWTYRDLAVRSRRLAGLLRGLGVDRGTPVGIWMERSLHMLAAVMATLEAGGTYVPIDPAWPAERAATILAGTGAPVVLVSRGTLPALERIRWRLPRLRDAVCPDLEAPEPEPEALDTAGIRSLFDLVAEQATDRVSAGGFVSRRTGLSFGEAEVDEYRDRVLSLATRWLRPDAQALEVGCGSGLILWELARQVKRCVGLDPSERTQERNRHHARTAGIGNVELHAGFAHEIGERFPPGSFDLIVLASTVQFFPGPRYLEQVIAAALRLLAPGGAVLLADVIDARREASTEQLALPEELFHELGAAEIHRRSEGFANELGERYDVILRPGTTERSRRIWTGWHVERSPDTRLPAVGSPADVAYVIHTSGSTGAPKGIAVQHAPAVNLIDWVNRTLGIGEEDRLLFVTSLCFDLSVWDIFGMLAAGGTVHLAAEEELREPAELARLLLQEPITVWDSAPAALQQLVPLFPTAAARPLRLVMLSGDWIPVSLPDRVRAAFPATRVISLGGATEATVWSNWYPIRHVDPRWPSIPYGRPIANARYLVLDGSLLPCPIGFPGDLYIGGACLCTGYAGQPELTAAAFGPDPFAAAPGARLYRTGDRARLFPDGNLEFLGRVDQQVKIRGYRIELGEIEAALASLSGVRACVVLARRDLPGGGGEPGLVAYVAGDATADTLRQSLRERLPAYMVPAVFVRLEALPVTSNGKVDRQALPVPQPFAEVYEAPDTEVQKAIAETWQAVLRIERIGLHDSFFELGGTSLSLVEVRSRLRDALGREVSLVDLFRSPTVASLALLLAPPVEEGAERPASSFDGARQRARRRRLAVQQRHSGGAGDQPIEEEVL